MTAREELKAAIRLRLPHPRDWTATMAEEARSCSGGCRGRVVGGLRVVAVAGGCLAHHGRVTV